MSGIALTATGFGGAEVCKASARSRNRENHTIAARTATTVIAATAMAGTDHRHLRAGFDDSASVAAIDASLIIDDVADVHTDTKLHAPRLLDLRIAFCHNLLQGECTFDRAHDAGELGQNTVARRVNDAAAELADHWQHHHLMVLEVT